MSAVLGGSHEPPRGKIRTGSVRAYHLGCWPTRSRTGENNLILRIRDWDHYFENASSRKLKRLEWVAIPNKTDGEGYTALVDHPNAAAHLGAWYAIVEAASKQAPRGNLPGGIPHDIGGISRSLGRMSRLPAKVFEEVLPRLLEIGWLEDADAIKIESNQQNVRDLLAKSPNASAESANVVADDGRKVAAQGIELQGITGKGIETQKPLRAPCAADLNGQTSPRFEEWWEVWHATRGSNHRTAAQHAWMSVVSLELSDACFECTRSYLQSLGDPSKGYNPENFLFEQRKDRFTARWPARAAPASARKLTPLEELQQERNAKRRNA